MNLKARLNKRKKLPVQRLARERLRDKSHLRWLSGFGPSFRIILALVFLVSCSFLFSSRLGLQSTTYRIGDISAAEVIAPFTFPVPKSDDEYRSEVAETVKSVPVVFNSLPGRKAAVLDSVGRFFSRLEAVAAVDSETPTETLTPESFPDQISAQSLAFLFLPVPRQQAGKLVRSLVDRLMDRGIASGFDDLPEDRSAGFILVTDGEETAVPGDQVIDARSLESVIREELERSEVRDPQLFNTVFDILFYHLQPNLNHDRQATNDRVQEEITRISRNKSMVIENERIVGDHERITQEILDKLNALDRFRAERVLGENRWLRNLPWIGQGIHVFLLLVILVIYLRWFRPNIYSNESSLLLLLIIVLGVLFASRWVLSLEGLPYAQYLIPIPVAAMLITILIDTRLAILLTFMMIILIGHLPQVGYPIMFYSFCGSMVGIYSLSRVRYRHDFYKPVGFLSLVNILSISALEMMRFSPVSSWLESSLWGFIGAFLASVVTIGLYPILESLFQLTTDSTVLALSDLNRPLLKRLAIEAPGTYHHSVVIGNLAEAAAEAIDADPLLARVGSYYHDIGKMSRPEYFIENQMGAENKHEKLSPTVSALILKAHVEDGVDMARKARLPRAVIDFIREHHATSLMTYFYRKALDSNPGEEVIEDDFRYPGPRPRRKETAILLLADAVHAASRTLKDPTPARIRNLVAEIVDGKYRDSEMDDSNLTFSDLHKIKETFITHLTGTFHTRIEYPKEVKPPGS
jgi:putative nucleotidyltransferase with HDIG domain